MLRSLHSPRPPCSALPLSVPAARNPSVSLQCPRSAQCHPCASPAAPNSRMPTPNCPCSGQPPSVFSSAGVCLQCLHFKCSCGAQPRSIHTSTQKVHSGASSCRSLELVKFRFGGGGARGFLLYSAQMSGRLSFRGGFKSASLLDNHQKAQGSSGGISKLKTCVENEGARFPQREKASKTSS